MKNFIFISSFVLCLISYFFFTPKGPQKNSRQQLRQAIPSSLPFIAPATPKVQPPSQNKVAIIKKPLQNTKQKTQTTIEEGPDYQDEDEFVANGLKQIEWMRSIPGAAEIVDHIVDRLQRHPEAINFAPFTASETVELGDDYLEKMIPDPELRQQWQKLMQLIAGHVEQETLKFESQPQEIL